MKVEYISHMGSDLTAVNAARVSFDRESAFRDDGTLSDRDKKLIDYLAKHKHMGCFEHQTVTLRLKVPLFVARQIQRHRTFCLAGDNIISFSRPDNGSHYPYRLDRLYKNWNDPAQRVRLMNMNIRSVNEDDLSVFSNRIEDVIYSGKKHVYTMRLSNGAEVTASEDHRILTQEGWLTIKDLMDTPVPVLAANGHVVDSIESFWPDEIESTEWRWIPGWENIYEVSDAGEVRCWTNTRGSTLAEPRVKTRTENTQGYACVSLSRGGVSRMYNCHALVMEAFVGARPEGQEVRHLDGNRLNSHVSNLAYGFPKDNHEDRKKHGTTKYKGTKYYDVLEIVYRGEEDTYDISVAGPHHNFFAGGVVVHNSYNEVSRRYVKDNLEFYWPDEWRKAAENVKQGSSDESFCGWESTELTILLQEACHAATKAYNKVIKYGLCAEQARMVLPQNLYTTFYMTGSLRNWVHFLKLRMDSHAQQEVQEVAEAVGNIIGDLYPDSFSALMRWE